MDLSKLTPLPLRIVDDDGEPYVGEITGFPVLLSERGNVDDLEWYLLARNAFDVQMRRGWGVLYHDASKRWLVVKSDGKWMYALEEEDGRHFSGTNPLIALVEADKWMCKDAPDVR